MRSLLMILTVATSMMLSGCVVTPYSRFEKGSTPRYGVEVSHPFGFSGTWTPTKP